LLLQFECYQKRVSPVVVSLQSLPWLILLNMLYVNGLNKILSYFYSFDGLHYSLD
jgi:hypothetical protein